MTTAPMKDARCLWMDLVGLRTLVAGRPGLFPYTYGYFLAAPFFPPSLTTYYYLQGLPSKSLPAPSVIRRPYFMNNTDVPGGR